MLFNKIQEVGYSCVNSGRFRSPTKNTTKRSDCNNMVQALITRRRNLHRPATITTYIEKIDLKVG